MDAESESGAGFRCGFVSLVGRPNAGKSTLMNALLDAKVSITTPKPQTTRNMIRGVLTRPESQVIFVDTPGIHEAGPKKLNQTMVEMAHQVIGDVDVNLLLVDATSALTRDGSLAPGIASIIELIRLSGRASVVAVNKVDRVPQKEDLLPIIEALSEAHAFVAIVPVSALKSRGLEPLLDALTAQLPEGPQLYPEDMFTDQAERFLAAEMIREALTTRLRQELPYAVAVEVERFEEPPTGNLLEIQAVIHVERESQKGIVIGKGGRQIKSIGRAAREELERFFGRKVFLETFVRVQPNWSEDRGSLERFGYTVKE